MQAQPVESLLRSLRWLQTSREYSDLKIICGRKTFQVHRAIICPRSKYFATSCRWAQDGGVKDEIRLDDDDPTIVGLMIDYLYQMDYDDLLPSKNDTSTAEEDQPETASTGWVSPIEESVTGSELLVAPSVSYHGSFGTPGPVVPGFEEEHVPEPEPNNEPSPAPDFFDIPPSQAFKSPFSKHKEKSSKLEPTRLEPDGQDLHTARLTVNTLVYAMADKYEIDSLKDIAKTKFEKAVLQDWKSPAFAYVAELVSSTTPTSDRGLRTIIADTINRHPELINYEEIQDLLDSGNGMAWALVQILLSGRRQVNKPSQTQIQNNLRRYL